jgi:outer membrane protein OmpA-like peptidoglycan-associated protein/tetratricopeptide (TPR) repeat protein
LSKNHNFTDQTNGTDFYRIQKTMKAILNKSFLIVLLLAPLLLFGQKKENPKKVLSKAREAVRVEEYRHALPHLRKLDSLDPTNHEVHYLYGIVYLKIDKREKALENLRKAGVGVEKFDNINYYMARAYHLNHEFDSAVMFYEKHITEDGRDPSEEETKFLITQAKVGSEFHKNPQDVEVFNMGNVINTPFPEFAPVISADETRLIFTSRRPGNFGGIDDETNQQFEDIYIVEKDEAGEWGKPRNMGRMINTENHDASIGLSPDGDELYIYRSNKTTGRLSGDIYYSDFEKGDWTQPKRMQEGINSKGWEPHASITADEQTFFFTSDREEDDTKGGRDIFIVKRLPDLTWAKPQNMSVINTEFDEDSPFIHPDGKTLYFSSNGDKSMGGFDIFISELDEATGSWSEPKNMGYPINTAGDDIYFVWSADKTRGYFSSTRGDSNGETDLYMVSFPEKKVNLIVLKGKVTDARTGDPLAATIEIVDNKTQKIVNIANSNDFSGRYTVILPPQKDYGIRVSREGYLFKSANINVPDQFEYLEVIQNIALKPIDYNQYEPLANVKFTEDNGLRVESEPELKALKELSESLPDGYKMEIMVHSDNESDSLLNTFLTQAKAEAVIERLKDMGLSGDNLFASGVGPKYPAFSNDTESGKKKNNRLEYILRKDKENVGISAAFTDPNDTTEIVAAVEDDKHLLHTDHKVFFKLGSSILDERSYVAIDEIAKYMENFPFAVIEVGGHTDNVGSHDFNIKLAERRASVVAQQIVFRGGVDKERIRVKSYGETQPIATNKTAAGRNANRRTEFKIFTKMDDELIDKSLKKE